MYKCNPSLMEWLNSPIVYIKDEFTYSLLKEASKDYFSPVSSIYHYFHMGLGNFKKYLQGDLVKIKKYFYVIRPILACRWIQRYDTMPPVKFEEMMPLIEKYTEECKIINELLVKKKAGEELNKAEPILKLNSFLEDNFNYFKKILKTFKGNNNKNVETLNNIFLKVLDK